MQNIWSLHLNVSERRFNCFKVMPKNKMSHYYTKTLVLTFGLFLTQVTGTIVNDGQPLFCRGAMISQVRIQGCDQEPCNLKKGLLLPLEVDFNFTGPPSFPDDVSLTAFAPYWAVPPNAFGSYLTTGRGCADMGLGDCPPRPGVSYTLKADLYTSPEAENTLTHEKTGEVRSGWSFWILDEDDDGEDHSYCYFDVRFNITE